MLGRQVVAAREVARVDTLTGTLRRGAFEAELELGLAAAARLGHPLTLAFVDVDHFKRINDLGGHAAGDQVLRRLGAVIAATLRNTDRCGRWGGEEFVLMLPGLAPQQAPRLLRRLTRRLASERIAVPAGCEALTLSIGYAGCGAGERPDGRLLIRRADEAMYAAKQRGRDTVVGWHELGGDTPAAAEAPA
nr:GGDEF domain-containing protein [Rubrivivax gelatinosus]